MGIQVSEEIQNNKPVLSISVGMQVLLEKGFEGWDRYKGDGGKLPENDPGASAMVKFQIGNTKTGTTRPATADILLTKDCLTLNLTPAILTK